MASSQHPILLYDGHCALCNAWVRILLALDTCGRLRFAALQSEFARTCLRDQPLDLELDESVVFLEARGAMEDESAPIHPRRAHTKSDAILHAIAQLGSPWKYLRHARHIPRGLRDRLYELVARHRYDWFGRYASCPLPPSEHRSRFLDQDPV